jgi:acetyl-CoA carboxylase biotin carboxyl carrier protein
MPAPGQPAPQAPAEAAAREEPDGHVVRAPMVGLFYEAAAPGKPAFVTLGQNVRKGDVLCIIEAMKIMNQIEADVGGVIAKILVQNGEPVEYGQPLFVIREP